MLNVDIIRAFAELLRWTKSAPLEPAVIQRLMHFVEDTAAADVGDFERTKEWAWVPNEEMRGDNPWRSATASTVLALDALNRMLDVRINDDIFKHFSVRQPDDLDVPELGDLFYPDYGLASELCDGKLRRNESIAVTLERMRAHVRGVRLREHPDRLFSLILHGPPGTGKSTFVESLAKTAAVPLVEVTPSDLIAGGVDAIERTARAVFQALSLLTRVVIVFDEFDPVLLQRQDDQKEATAFSFLTPGMLPKLKALHKAAKRRSVTYVLNTNHIGKLDDAAIRGGRFDAKIGVYPPDVLSRAGRLASAISEYFFPSSQKSGSANEEMRTPKDWKPPDNLKKRFEQVVLKVRLGPMHTLAAPGWFTAPTELRPREDVFNDLLLNRPIKKLNPESEPRFSSDKQIALHELEEFVCVDVWDQVALGFSDDAKVQYSREMLESTSKSRKARKSAGATGAASESVLSQVLHLCPAYEQVSAEREKLRQKAAGVPAATEVTTEVRKDKRASKRSPVVGDEE